MTTVIRLLFLDLVGVAPRFRDRLIDLPEPLLLDERIAERVGDEQPKLGERRALLHQRLHLGDQPKLRHRERTELEFKADQAFRRGLDRAAHGACALIVRDRRCDPAQHAEQERAGANRRIGHDHVGGGETGGRSNSGPRKASSTRLTIADTTSGGV